MVWRLAVVRAFRQIEQQIFTRRDLQTFLGVEQAKGTLPERTSLNQLLEVLKAEGELHDCEIPSVEVGGKQNAGGPYNAFRRFVRHGASAFEVGLSLRLRSYLSHSSAMVLHGLSEATDPASIYVNKEQSAKPASSGSLAQSSIDRAFRNRPRISQYVFLYQGAQIVLLSGKNTGNLGVREIPDATGTLYPSTQVERTLVDITVRPAYAGGVSSVLEAYRRAKGRVSIANLFHMLGRLGYVYPYHQAVGFYLRKAEYSDEASRPLRDLGFSYDFYLAHQMSNPAYDPEWRIFYPSELR